MNAPNSHYINNCSEKEIVNRCFELMDLMGKSNHKKMLQMLFVFLFIATISPMPTGYGKPPLTNDRLG